MQEYGKLEDLIQYCIKEPILDAEMDQIQFITTGLKTEGLSSATVNACKWEQTKDYFTQFCRSNPTNG